MFFSIFNYYLIIKSTNGDYGLPKGRMEENESEIQTAIRELKEETNIEVEVIDGFRHQIEYKLRRYKDTVKQVIYFLGKCINNDIICQESEVSLAKFMTLDEALKVLTFDTAKNLIKEAEKFIK